MSIIITCHRSVFVFSSFSLSKLKQIRWGIRKRLMFRSDRGEVTDMLSLKYSLTKWNLSWRLCTLSYPSHCGYRSYYIQVQGHQCTVHEPFDTLTRCTWKAATRTTWQFRRSCKQVDSCMWPMSLLSSDFQCHHDCRHHHQKPEVLLPGEPTPSPSSVM